MPSPLLTCDDSTLIQLALAGDGQSFVDLMDRHLAALKRCIASMVLNKTDAEDLLQEVTFKVWRHLSTFQSDATFRTWMIRVAINEVLTSFREQRRVPVCLPLNDFDTLASASDTPYLTLVRAELRKVVRSAVVGLPAPYSQTLILHYFKELSVREIAEVLHSSVPAVKTRLFRARLLLLAEIHRSGVHGFGRAA